MSDRRAVPGVSVPEVFGRQAKRKVLPRLGPAIRYGLPTPENPLGLYEAISAEQAEGDHDTPQAAYPYPYDEPDVDFMRRNDIHFDPQHDEHPDPFAVGAGLVMGGIIACVRAGNNYSDTEQRGVADMESLAFGSRVCAMLQGRIAAQLHAEHPHMSTFDIWRVLRASYDDTAGRLTTLLNDDAVRVEQYLGIAHPGAEVPYDPVEACFKIHYLSYFDHRGRLSRLPIKASLELANEQWPDVGPRCGGAYVLHRGTPLPVLLWLRTARIARDLNWLLPKMVLEQTTGAIE